MDGGLEGRGRTDGGESEHQHRDHLGGGDAERVGEQQLERAPRGGAEAAALDGDHDVGGVGDVARHLLQAPQAALHADHQDLDRLVRLLQLGRLAVDVHHDVTDEADDGDDGTAVDRRADVVPPRAVERAKQRQRRLEVVLRKAGAGSAPALEGTWDGRGGFSQR